jgi:hypothetical protein
MCAWVLLRPAEAKEQRAFSLFGFVLELPDRYKPVDISKVSSACVLTLRTTEGGNRIKEATDARFHIRSVRPALCMGRVFAC